MRRSPNTCGDCGKSATTDADMKPGKFITIEGIEGVGKSTNMATLVESIEAAGHKVLTTREPGGTPFAEEIRDMLMNRSDEPLPEVAELLMRSALG